jgi:murein DD-endopeptidase MepM/ murein hydrolase activator NlpD
MCATSRLCGGCGRLAALDDLGWRYGIGRQRHALRGLSTPSKMLRLFVALVSLLGMASAGIAQAQQRADGSEGSGGVLGVTQALTAHWPAIQPAVRVPAALSIGLDYGYPYGPTAPLALRGSIHRGIDFVARAGTPVISTSFGTVVQRSYDAEIGGHVIIRIPWPSTEAASGVLYVHFAHLAPNIVARRGQSIRPGDVVGFVEDSRYLKYAEGDHVHLQITEGQDVRSRAVNPHSLWNAGPGVVSCLSSATAKLSTQPSLVAPLPC